MMRALVSLAFLLLSCCAADPVATQSHVPAPDAYVIQGAATEEHLWVLMTGGAVLEFDRASSSRRTVVENGVYDIQRSNGRLLAMRQVTQNSNSFQLLDLTAGEALLAEFSLASAPLLLDTRTGLSLLSQETLLRFQDGEWQRQDLKARLRGWPGINARSGDGRFIYVGHNHGEWGGGLQGIEIATGRVFEVSRIDGNELCDGPLNPACDPVTAVIPDGRHPDCVLAAIGLAHMLSEGRILRICGDKVAVVYSAKIPRKSLFEKDFGETWPFFNLVEMRNGWAAISYGRLFRSSGGTVTESEVPEFAPWHGLNLAVASPEFLVLSTSLNARHSLSGDTPLLIPVAD